MTMADAIAMVVMTGVMIWVLFFIGAVTSLGEALVIGAIAVAIGVGDLLVRKARRR